MFQLEMILLIYLLVLILNDDIQDYFEYIITKHETLSEDLPNEIYPNKIKNRIVFKIKTSYNLELLTPETMRLLESTKKLWIKIKMKMYQN